MVRFLLLARTVTLNSNLILNSKTAASAAAAAASPPTHVTPATVVTAADAARIAELENSVQQLRAAVEEVSANLRNEVRSHHAAIPPRMRERSHSLTAFDLDSRFM
jgi:hypothetical protein